MSNLHWHVLYTKPRNEKKVAERLHVAGFEVYCPLKKTKQLWSDRWKWVEEPLFHSYVFIRIAEHDREQVFHYPGIVRYLFWLGKPAIIRDIEIKAMKGWLNDFSTSNFEIQTLATNVKVKLLSGPMEGAEALIDYVEGKTAKLFLPSLNCTLKIDLRHTVLELI